MYLKSLELSGFKSFAKRTVLDFSTPITAVVGPNGSGKSNVAEALQWALGEQSMKSLRGKRGEDLIFAGSPSSPRLGRASVSVVFDNRGKKFGTLDFDEIIIERKVYRDGVNEYFLNGSKSRLKDIIEVLSNVGLGASQHHIIGQGEADRILYASPVERREMIEDALGIKIFQLKKKESERKLEATEENMKQVQSLRREIAPHLRFLSTQAEKAEKSSEIRVCLKEKLLEYLGKEKSFLARQEEENTKMKSGPREELVAREQDISALKKKLDEEESSSKGRTGSANLEAIKIKTDRARARIFELERDLGRLEGMIEMEKAAKVPQSPVPVAASDLKKFLESTVDGLQSAMHAEAVEDVRRILDGVLATVKQLLAKMSASPAKKHDVTSLESRKSAIEKDLETLKQEEDEARRLYGEMSSRMQDSLQNLRGIEKRIYELETDAARLKDSLRAVELAGEKLRLRREEFERDWNEALPHLDGAMPPVSDEAFNDEARDVLRREVERLKIKLEEAGGVDASVLKEFEEVKLRDAFLEKELTDLGQAAGDLRKIITELEGQLEADFKKGIEKINREFQKYFETMFGGGRAELKLALPKRQRRTGGMSEDMETDYSESEPEEDDAEQEEGIEVAIDLPRKRIRSLDMLSGGERALSSIALLFAMSAVNPPPFLILDETDAALDEANSRRYSSMLTDLSKQTQLIVITHNRETMHSAGSLYGVTLGRDSVSRLISVKLEEAEKIAKK